MGARVSEWSGEGGDECVDQVAPASTVRPSDVDRN